MTPPEPFVRDLRAYDSRLRIRWARHTRRWYIEREMPPRSPQWTLERPNAFGKGARARDLWEGWQEGYVLVLAVDPEMLHWNLVAPVLAESDMQKAGGWAKLNEKMDRAEEARDQAAERKVENW